MERKRFGWVVYIIPVIIAVVYAVLFLVFLPKAYGGLIQLMSHVFKEPHVLVEFVTDPDALFKSIYLAIGVHVLNWLFIIGFGVSLFFVGRKLHFEKEPTADDAKAVGNTPYLKALELYNMCREDSFKCTDELTKSVRYVMEKLRNESDFGTLSPAVDVENEIYDALVEIEEKLEKFAKAEDTKELDDSVISLCQKIERKLKTRTELKKK